MTNSHSGRTYPCDVLTQGQVKENDSGQGVSNKSKARARIFDRIFKNVEEGRTLWGKKVETIEKLFDAFDVNADGVISKEEFTIGMRRSDLGISIVQIEELLQLLDADGGGDIDKQEWTSFMKTMKQHMAKMVRFVLFEYPVMPKI